MNSQPNDPPPVTLSYSIEGDQDAAALAIAAVQKTIVDPTKGKTADTGKYKYDYADLPTVLASVRPALSEAGIALLQPPITTPRAAGAQTILLGKGWAVSVKVEFPLGSVTGPMTYGSAISYARRYGVLGLLGLATPDDDGDAAQGHTGRQETRRGRDADKAEGRGPAIPTDKIVQSFAALSVTERMLVAELEGTPLGKMTMEQAAGLRGIYQRLKSGEQADEVLSSAAMALADGDPFDDAPMDDGTMFPAEKGDPEA